MIRAIAALAVASATGQSPATLTSTAPWWERVTVTVTDDGKTQSCRYETSLKPNNAQDCSVVGSQAAAAKSSTGPASPGAKTQYTRITFERRYSPGAKPNLDALQPSETLLSGQVLALAIDPRGTVKDCKVIERSGPVTPQYGCDEAATEHFEASAASAHTEAHASAPAREGYLSVLVYGHSEHVV